MAFQFMCPQGHVLQGDESQAGMMVQCPQCATTFIIPSPQAAPEAAAPPPPPDEAYDEDDDHDAAVVDFTRSRGRGGRFGFLEEQDSAAGAGEVEKAPEVLEFGPRKAFDPLQQGAGHRLVNIPCPNGHSLTTPYDTMGEEVLCPHCGVQFVLQYSNSIEYQQDVQMRKAMIEHKEGKKWLMWAVIAACGVVMLLLGLMIASST